jgi:uncharacterized membrane protein
MFSLPPLFFDRPEILYCLALLPFLWFFQRRALRGVSSFVGLLLHTVVLVLLLLAVAGLHTLKPGANTTPLLVVDLSHSLTPSQRRWMSDTIAQNLHPSSDTPTVIFAGRQRLTNWSEAAALLQDPPATLQLDDTNLEGALTTLLASMRDRNVYLLSDGWETQADARSLAPLLAEKALKIYSFPPPPAEAAPNVALQRLSAPSVAAGGEEILVSIALDNANPTPVRGELTLRQGEKLIWRQELTLTPGSSLITHPVALTGDGLIPLRALFTPRDQKVNTNAQDDQAATWVTVAPQEKVMLVGARAQDNRYLEKALENRGLNVTAIDVAAKAPSIPSESFSAIILNNVAKDKLPMGLMNGLDEYVSRGGGLLMIGGEESLGLGGYKGTPVEKALPVSLIPPQKPERHTAVVLVIDTSGSMRKEDKLLYAKEGVRTVARNLKDADLLGIIGFDREPFVVVPLEYLGKTRGDIEYRLERLTAAGGTFLLPALEEAKRQLERRPAMHKQIVVLTDGETGGSGSDYLDLVSVMHRELKITISAIALGSEANLRLLSRIADYGGGAFHHTTDPSSLPDIFLEEMEEKGEEKTMVEKDLVPLPNPDSPLLKDGAAGGMPPVKGYVETSLKNGARLDVALRTDGQRPPLLASWTYGRGKAVAFTSDANGRWSAPWVSWDGFSRFWSQVVRWCFPESKREKDTHFSVTLGHNDAGLVIDVFSFGLSEEGRTASAKINGPGNNDGTLSLERLAPGHYQGTFANPQAGDYRIDVTVPSGEKIGPLGYTIPPRRTGEASQPQPNLPLLEALASATGGSVNPNPATLVQPTSPPEQQPLLPYLLPLAMALYFLELIVRRLTPETVKR